MYSAEVFLKVSHPFYRKFVFRKKVPDVGEVLRFYGLLFYRFMVHLFQLISKTLVSRTLFLSFLKTRLCSIRFFVCVHTLSSGKQDRRHSSKDFPRDSSKFKYSSFFSSPE